MIDDDLVLKEIQVTCCWCEEHATFDGDDPETEWREAGWLTVIKDSTVGGEDDERDYCSVACAISAL